MSYSAAHMSVVFFTFQIVVSCAILWFIYDESSVICDTKTQNWDKNVALRCYRPPTKQKSDVPNDWYISRASTNLKFLLWPI